MSRRRIAVVPVSSVDTQTDEALAYAGTLATEVIAISTDQRLERQWRESGLRQPLLIVPATNGDRAAAIHRAVAVLERSQQRAQVNLVVPRDYNW